MEVVDLKAYWEQVSRFSQYPEDKRADGYALGLLAEAGEVAGLFEGEMRGKYTEDEVMDKLPHELGDVCFHLAGCVSRLSGPGRFEVADLGHWSDEPDPKTNIPRYLVGHAYEVTSWGVRLISESAVSNVLGLVGCLAEYAGTTLQAVLENNVSKLTARHG